MKKVQRVEALFELLRVVLGLLLAYILTLVIIILTSDVTPQEVITNFVLGPFTTSRRFGQLRGKFIPYVLGGCGMCFIDGCGRFNLIGEGVVNFAPAVACIVLFNTPIFNNVPWIVGVGILLIICCAVGHGSGGRQRETEDFRDGYLHHHELYAPLSFPLVFEDFLRGPVSGVPVQPYVSG